MKHIIILFFILSALSGCGTGTLTRKKPKADPTTEFVKGCFVATTMSFPNRYDVRTLLRACREVEREFRLHENQKNKVKKRPGIYIENLKGFQSHAV